ncbi:MAG: peptidoglycan -binding protein [Xanthomonadales bacterium]|nr:peptidoglycan -binding protein [Xanthomonadales bacterium]
MASLVSRRRRALDYWPGFVDALSALLMVLVFLLLVFSIGQFALSDALTGRDKALAQLNAELAELARTLSLEREARLRADARGDELSASLSSSRAEAQGLSVAFTATGAALQQSSSDLDEAQQEVARLDANVRALEELKQQLEAEIAARLAQLEERQNALDTQTELSAAAQAQVELLNRQLLALREQLDELSSALDLARAQNAAKDVRIDELGKELNRALAEKVNELQRYRSNFFGRLREVLGDRADIQIVGDRFVVPSELLFASGSDELTTAARPQLDRLAQSLRELTNEIPAEIDWVLRIDGHTDRRPISTARFPSNWELSTARAIAIVKYLVAAGIPPERLAANGFGEFRPLNPSDNDAAYRINRRIEIQLTNR